MRHQVKTQSVCLTCTTVSTTGSLIHRTRRQSHYMCGDCVLMYLRIELNKILSQMRAMRGAAVTELPTIPCPGKFCSEKRNLCQKSLSITEWMNVFPAELCEKAEYTDLLRILAVVESSGSLAICQSADCLNAACRSGPIFSCALCKVTWCANCGVSPHHVGLSCLQYRCNELSTLDENEMVLMEMHRSGSLRFCPVCSHGVTKDGGCNKIVCSRCGTKWCWLCGESGIDYGHFNVTNGGSCGNRLWEREETI